MVNDRYSNFWQQRTRLLYTLQRCKNTLDRFILERVVFYFGFYEHLRFLFIIRFWQIFIQPLSNIPSPLSALFILNISRTAFIWEVTSDWPCVCDIFFVWSFQKKLFIYLFIIFFNIFKDEIRKKKKNTYVIVSVIVYTRIALSNYITHLFALLGKKFDEIRRGAGAGDKPFTKTRMVKLLRGF